MHEEEIHGKMLQTATTLVQSSLFLANSTNEVFHQIAIALTASSIEILLKARLFHEHWSLIFEKVDSASWEDLIKGDFRSASWDTCCKRLLNIKQEDLNNQRSDITLLMKDRNKILHCYCPESIELVSSLKMGYRVWQELVKKWNYTDCEINELEKEILTLNNLLEKNWIKFRTVISDKKNLIECPWCRYEGMQLGIEYLKYIENKELIECQVCYHKISPKDLAEILGVRTPWDFDSSHEELVCPACDSLNTCAQVHPNIYLCTYCGLHAELVRCMTCNIPYFEEETGMYPRCLAHRLD